MFAVLLQSGIPAILSLSLSLALSVFLSFCFCLITKSNRVKGDDRSDILGYLSTQILTEMFLGVFLNEKFIFLQITIDKAVSEQQYLQIKNALI